MSTPTGPPDDDPVDRVEQSIDETIGAATAHAREHPDDFFEPTPPGMVGPEHVDRGFELTSFRHASQVADEYGMWFTAWVCRRAYRTLRRKPLLVPYPKDRLDGPPRGRRAN